MKINQVIKYQRKYFQQPKTYFHICIINISDKNTEVYWKKNLWSIPRAIITRCWKPYIHWYYFKIWLNDIPVFFFFFFTHPVRENDTLLACWKHIENTLVPVGVRFKITSDALIQHSESGTFWSQTNRNYLFSKCFDLRASKYPLAHLAEFTVNREVVDWTSIWR